MQIPEEEIRILEMAKTIIQQKNLSNADYPFYLNGEKLTISNIKCLDSFDTCSIIGATYIAGKLLGQTSFSYRSLYWLREFYRMKTKQGKNKYLEITNWDASKKEAIEFIDSLITTVKTRIHW